jgi:hypothetical protein
MANKQIDITLLKDEDIDEVIRFYNRTYKSNRTRAKFDWEFKHAAAGPAIYVIAKDSETNAIVGTQCAIPIVLITGEGKSVLTAKSEDTLVDPAYRGLNIFENMYSLLFEECRKAGIKYLWGFTSAKKPFLKLGFSIPYDHSQSLKVFDTWSSYLYLSGLNVKNTTASKFKIFALCCIAKLVALKSRLFSANSEIRDIEFLVTDKSQTLDNTEVWKDSFQGYFAIRQDDKYLDWRVKNNPYHETIVAVRCTSQSKTIASIIFNEHKPGIWYLLNDLYTKSLNVNQKAAILNQAIKLLRKNFHVNLIRAMDFSHNDYANQELEQRKKSGFVHLDRGISFVWISPDKDNTLDARNFILSRIATQGIV